MIPIGIVTRDRVAYLDVTLRSLSATTLPAGVPVTIYDDASMDPLTRAYYTTDHTLFANNDWAVLRKWASHGLDVIPICHREPAGIRDRIDIVKLSPRPLGVVNASCRAVCNLFEKNPDAPGIILLQDDVLFKFDWYDRLITTANNANLYTALPLGLLAGIKLNHRFRDPSAMAISSGITAQCLYISRMGFERRFQYFKTYHNIKKRFDDTLRREMTSGHLWAGCIYPFVCQHFGVQSLVRKERVWTQTRPRVGYYSQPPYALADAVKQFKR